MTRVRLSVFEQERTEDPLIGSEALCYYVAKHFNLSPIDVGEWPIPEVERWAAWATAAETHKANEMDKEHQKIERSSRSARGMGGRY